MVPAAGLTAALVAYGHDVRVIGPAVLKSRFERAGARFRAFQHARPPHPIEVAVLEDNLLAWTRFIAGRRLADDVLAELKAEPTDVAVVDAFASAGFAAAEKAGVPVVALVHVLYAPSVDGPVAKQWDPTRPMVELTRRQLGVPELDPDAPVIAGLWARSPLVLACVPQPFDFPSHHLPGNVRYVGPVLDEPLTAARQPGRGRVLVSLSTTATRQHDLMQRILDGLSDIDVEVLCTLGGVPIADLRAPANASIVDWISPREVLPRTDLVVTHAGLGTVMSALASSVPLVCMPMARDQPLNAERVAALGLGIEQLPTASPELIRESVQQVLDDESFRQRAQSMAETIAAYGNGAIAVQELESLL